MNFDWTVGEPEGIKDWKTTRLSSYLSFGACEWTSAGETEDFNLNKITLQVIVGWIVYTAHYTISYWSQLHRPAGSVQEMWSQMFYGAAERDSWGIRIAQNNNVEQKFHIREYTHMKENSNMLH